jgi:hypothetical protein
MVRETLARDIEMLQFLAVQEKGLVAAHYKLTLRGLDSWLHRIRERRRDFQWWINNILSLEKRNARLKKILLSSKIPDHLLGEKDDDIDEEEEDVQF